MSDYTPDTEEVRDAYKGFLSEWKASNSRSKDAGFWFDRWLEQHDKEVRAKRDQELVEAINELPRTQIGDHILGLLGVDEEALIKGENK